MLNRREFFIGVGATAVAVAVPVVYDPLVTGIRYQSWAFNTVRPREFMKGTITPDQPKVLSSFLGRLDKYKEYWPDLVWEPLEDVR